MTKLTEDKSPWTHEDPYGPVNIESEPPPRITLVGPTRNGSKIPINVHPGNIPESPINTTDGFWNSIPRILRYLLLILAIAAFIAILSLLIKKYFFDSPEIASTDRTTYRWIIKNEDVASLPPWTKTIAIDDTYTEVISENPSVIDGRIVLKEETIPVPSPPSWVSPSDCEIVDSDWETTALWMQGNFVSDFLRSKWRPFKVAVIDTWLSPWLQDVDYSRIDSTGSINITEPEGEIIDDQGHWSNVASLLQNFYPNSVIVAIKANRKWSETFSNIDVIRAIDHAIDNHVDLINLSLGWREVWFDSIKSKIDEAIRKGIVVIAAAWNDAQDTQLYYPASYDGVISVGSYGPWFVTSPFSNLNPDISSPGECIASNGTILNGTSFAAPIFAANIMTAKFSSDLPAKESELMAAYKSWSVRERGMLVFNYPKALWISAENAQYLRDHAKILNASAWLLKKVEVFRKQLKSAEDKEKYEADFEVFSKEFHNTETTINKAISDIEGLYQKNGVSSSSSKKFLSWVQSILREISDFIEGRSVVLDITNDKKLKESLGTSTCTDQISCLSDFNGDAWCKTEIINQKSWACGIFSTIIPEDTKLPASWSGIYTTIRSDQTAVTNTIFQWQKPLALDNRLLSEVTVDELRLSQNSERGVLLTYVVDELGVLNVEAKDLSNSSNLVAARIKTSVQFESQTFWPESTERADRYLHNIENKLSSFIKTH